MKFPSNPLWHMNHVSYQIICDLEFTGGKNRENKTLKQEMVKQRSGHLLTSSGGTAMPTQPQILTYSLSCLR